MFGDLAGVAWGIIIFAVAVVIGAVILEQFGSAVSGCGANYATYNKTSQLCTNASGTGTTNPSSATLTANYLNTQLGSSSGGLASYTPLIIIAIIGFAILGLFMWNRSKKA